MEQDERLIQNGSERQVMPANNNVKSKTDKSLLKKAPKGKKKGDAPGDRFTPPEGGWGWVVCLASFWANGTIFGILNTFGILYKKMLIEFGDGSKEIAFKTSWVGSLYIGMTFFSSPLASILVDRVGIRPTAFAGSILATAGMIASSFVSRLEILYFTYGIMLGIGSSLVYTPSMVILGHWFKKRLGMVNGLVAFGSAVFTMVLPFVLRVTLEDIGLRNTMRILAGLLAVLMLCSLTWKPQFDQRHHELDHYFSSTESIKDRCCSCCRWTQKYLNLSIWKNKGYVIWVMSVPVALLGYFIPFVHLVKHTSDILPDASGEILVTCIGATSGVGRLLFGRIADMPKVNRIRMQQVAFVAFGIATACIPFAKTMPSLIVITLIMGACDGCFVCLLGPIAFDLLGPRGAAQGLGFLLGLMSLPMTAGPPLAGLAYDKMHTYVIAFHAAGLPPLVGALMMFLVPSKISNDKGVTQVETLAHMSNQNLDKIQADEFVTTSQLSLTARVEGYGSHRDLNGATTPISPKSVEMTPISKDANMC